MSAPPEHAGQGKIARLPFALREELNQRLLDGQSGRKILGWLNARPEVIAILAEEFGGLRITDQNLSEWRKTGHAKWRARRQRLDATRELAHTAVKLAEAGGASLSEGAAALASGRVLELLETLADQQQTDPEAFTGLVAALKTLRSEDNKSRMIRVQQDRLGVDRQRLRQLEEQLALARQKFQRETCELFLRWRSDERTRAIADGPGSNDEKVEQLGRAMFGDLWQ
jgi:hypothetical protein